MKEAFQSVEKMAEEVAEQYVKDAATGSQMTRKSVDASQAEMARVIEAMKNIQETAASVRGILDTLNACCLWIKRTVAEAPMRNLLQPFYRLLPLLTFRSILHFVDVVRDGFNGACKLGLLLRRETFEARDEFFSHDVVLVIEHAAACVRQ